MLSFLAILLCAVTLTAQQSPSEESVRSAADAKEQESKSLWEAKKFTEAVRLLESEEADPNVRRYSDLYMNALYNLACANALMGETEQAVGHLRKLLDLGFHNVSQIEKDTSFDSVRSDTRFLEVIAAMKAIPDFWNGPAWNTAFQPDLSENDKIVGLSRFWSEVKYNFAWFEHLPGDFDWDALYISYLPKVRTTRSTLEYYRVLQELCARLKDGHTNIYLPSALAKEARIKPPIETRFIEGRVLVSEVRNEELKRSGIAPGLEILAVEGIPVMQYGAERIAPYESASTEQDLNIRTYERDLLRGKEGTAIDLTLRAPDGRTFQRSLERKSGQSNSGGGPEQDFEFRMLPGNVAYVALNTFLTATVQQEFERHFEEIAKSSALILDVRKNGGGKDEYGTAILSHLIEEPVSANEWRSRQYVPAYRAWGRPEGWVVGTPMTQPNPEHHYRNPVVVLTSAHTYSAAENFAADFDIMKRGTIIGEPTGGSSGLPVSFPLPGGGFAQVCSKQDRYPDGRQFVGRGIQPQILVRPTVADFRAGRDTVLQKALEYLASAPTFRP